MINVIMLVMVFLTILIFVNVIFSSIAEVLKAKEEQRKISVKKIIKNFNRN